MTGINVRSKVNMNRNIGTNDINYLRGLEASVLTDARCLQ